MLPIERESISGRQSGKPIPTCRRRNSRRRKNHTHDVIQETIFGDPLGIQDDQAIKPN